MKGQLTANWKNELIKALDGKSSAFLISDSNIPDEFVAEVAQVLSGSVATHCFSLEGGEQIKTLDMASTLYLEMDRAGIDRKALVVCMGGGTVSDLGAFAAGTYKRGLSLVLLPTTLLAAVDAALGGKNGVNLETEVGVVKNQVGTFLMPEFVGYDTRWLESVEEKEVRSGWAEMAKHSLIRKGGGQEVPDVISKPVVLKELCQLIESSADVKMDVVNRDEKESGERAVLNLGHTTGHAMESIAKGEITHGEGVAWGLGFMLYASVEKCGFEENLANECIKHILENINTPLRKFDATIMWKFMLKDKKNNSGEVKDVLLRKIGSADYDLVWDEGEFKELWEQYLSKFA